MRSRYTRLRLRRRAVPARHLAPQHPAAPARPRRRRSSGQRLEVLAVSGGGLFDAAGTVEFRAYYLRGRQPRATSTSAAASSARAGRLALPRRHHRQGSPLDEAPHHLADLLRGPPQVASPAVSSTRHAGRGWGTRPARSTPPPPRPARGRRRRSRLRPAGAGAQRRHRRVRDDDHPRQPAERGGEGHGVGDAGGHPRQPLAQPDQRGGRQRPEPEQRAAEPVPPLAYLRQHVGRPGDAAPPGARRAPCRRRRRRCRRARRSRRASARSAAASHSRAPSRCAAAPRARAHSACATRSSQAGSRPPISRCGSSTSSAAGGSATSFRSSAQSRPSGSPTGRPVSPCSRGSASSSCSAGWRSGATATVRRPRASACTRSAACCAIVPLGRKTAAGLPSSAATSGSPARSPRRRRRRRRVATSSRPATRSPRSPARRRRGSGCRRHAGLGSLRPCPDSARRGAQAAPGSGGSPERRSARHGQLPVSSTSRVNDRKVRITTMIASTPRW